MSEDICHDEDPVEKNFQKGIISIKFKGKNRI